ncbi:response regulator transcription factor [Streptomyces kurssanovii]|uniref:Response regulator transcription factor n=1 Tax=Streptomyces kurssanovii TaxID=67312 RepID=A0ABV3HUE5_9ACTN
MTDAGTGLGRTAPAQGGKASVLRMLPGGATAAQGVRLFLVGGDALARAGIRSLLDGQGGISVIGEDEPGPRALAALRAQAPDVLVVHGLREAHEADALLREVDPGIRVLTVGGAEPRGGTTAVLHGHLPHSTTSQQLAAAVSLAAAGYSLTRGPLPPTAPEPARAPATAARPEKAAPRPRAAATVSDVPPEQLTGRECQILDLVARGLSNTEIAQSLTLSEHTVKTHVQNLLNKLRLRNRVHVAIYAFETGLR